MPAKAAKGYYTPHSDYALGVKQSKAGEAVALAEQLAAKMQSRGTDFSFVAEINLRGLAEDLAAPDDGDGMPPPPKIKSTVLAYTVIARAAITAELEITKGGYEKVVGWLEPGTEIQAQQIGETTTGRQRVLDSKAWWVKGVPGEGWVSVHSVKGKKLLVPVLTQWMPKDKIRVEPDQWEGSATRQGVSFEYDPTFLPPAERRGKRNKLTKPVRELVQTPVANTWQMDRLNAAAAATVKHMFSNVGLRPERVRLDGEAEVLAWRPAPDVPHVVSQHKANPGRVYSRANQSDYYREPAGTWLDPDYLSFVQRRYVSGAQALRVERPPSPAPAHRAPAPQRATLCCSMHRCDRSPTRTSRPTSPPRGPPSATKARVRPHTQSTVSLLMESSHGHVAPWRRLVLNGVACQAGSRSCRGRARRAR